MLELKVIAGVSSLKHEQHGDMHILYIIMIIKNRLDVLQTFHN